MLIAEGHHAVPVCAGHSLRVGFDYWLSRVGLVVAGVIGLAVHYLWLEDVRFIAAMDRMGVLFSLIPFVTVAAILILRSRPWFSSEVRGDRAAYSFRNAHYAGLFMQANAGEVRGYSFARVKRQRAPSTKARRKKRTVRK